MEDQEQIKGNYVLDFLRQYIGLPETVNLTNLVKAVQSGFQLVKYIKFIYLFYFTLFIHSFIFTLFIFTLHIYIYYYYY